MSSTILSRAVTFTLLYLTLRDIRQRKDNKPLRFQGHRLFWSKGEYDRALEIPATTATAIYLFWDGFSVRNALGTLPSSALP